MNWIVFIFLVLDSDMISAFIIMLLLTRRGMKDNPESVRRLVILFGSIFLRGFCELFALTFGYVVRPVYTSGYLITYGIGRLAKTAAIWYLLFYFLRSTKTN